MVIEPSQGSFFVRYRIVSLSAAIVSNTFQHLAFMRTGKRPNWLFAVSVIALGISLVGLYQGSGSGS